MLGVKTIGGEVFYPIFQFRAVNGKVEVRPALAAMLKILKEHDPWAVASLVNIPASELGGCAPLQWECEGRDPEVLRQLALQVRREWDSGETF